LKFEVIPCSSLFKFIHAPEHAVSGKKSIFASELSRMNETDLIRKCCAQIELDVQWGPSDRWTSQDFEHLSELMFQKTKIKLSISTLKRVWGKVTYTNLPSVSTLNALAIYNGYESWREFWQQQNTAKPGTQAFSALEEVVPLKPWWRKPQLRKAVFMVTLMLIGLIIYLIFS
jgi:hypothetical protein